MITLRVSIESIYFHLSDWWVHNGHTRKYFLCMLFTNDVVLIDERRIIVDQKLELWRWTLELKYFWLGMTKTEYMRYQFSNDISNDGDISLDG
jgi:hypothetical protein